MVAALNNIVLRLLSVAPPGRVKFTILDPAELGQNFAGIMHLADYEDKLISNRIWTQTTQIEQQLADLNEHIEKVTQMYLRNEYATITEYNEKAGRIAEKYHFLVVADFPVNFSEVAVKRLMSIAASGPRCGVYTLLHWDQRRAAPSELVPDVLRNNGIWIQARSDSFVISDKAIEGGSISLDAPPDADSATELLQRVGKASIDSNRVEMPFEEVAPPDNALWTARTPRTNCACPSAAPAPPSCDMALGKGTRQHVLVAGKTGSGKSTLFHVMITNLALWCSPEQVEFYLVDFKKGVEFEVLRDRAPLPHARVVAIESDREFGLSVVLQRVDEELKRRGDLFRDLGVQDVAGYKKSRRQGAHPAHAADDRRVPGIFRGRRPRVAECESPAGPARAPGARVRHPCPARLANARGRLHAREAHVGPDGRAHRPAMQRSRRVSHHGRDEPGAAAAVPAW